MTLVDVGCDDGWLICQLEDLPFARMIGVEPRRKNLDKGRVIRELMGIETRCEFRQGSIENLEEVMMGEKADVVICAGLFHHLASTAKGVEALHAICSQFLFLETICFPVGFEDARLRNALELKDIPYFFGSQAFGVTGHKLESGYYDGSALRMSVVSIPSVEALKMFLDVGGFSNIKIEVDAADYSEAVAGGYRSFSAVCLTALPRTNSTDTTPKLILDYEGGLVRTLMPIEVMNSLYQTYCLLEPAIDGSVFAKVISNVISADDLGLSKALGTLRGETENLYAYEICKNMRYAPLDKIALEYGKCLVAKGDLINGEQVLFRITQRLNADWRSVYRAFCIIAWSLRERGDIAGESRYANLCRIANPQFPSALIEGGVALFEPLSQNTKQN